MSPHRLLVRLELGTALSMLRPLVRRLVYVVLRLRQTPNLILGTSGPALFGQLGYVPSPTEIPGLRSLNRNGLPFIGPLLKVLGLLKNDAGTGVKLEHLITIGNREPGCERAIPNLALSMILSLSTLPVPGPLIGPFLLLNLFRMLVKFLTGLKKQEPSVVPGLHVV